MAIDHPYDDVGGVYIDADALVEMAEDGLIGDSDQDTLAWQLLLSWCHVLEVTEVDEEFIFDDDDWL